MNKGIFHIHHAIIDEIFVVGLKGLDVSDVGTCTVSICIPRHRIFLYTISRFWRLNVRLVIYDFIRCVMKANCKVLASKNFILLHNGFPIIYATYIPCIIRPIVYSGEYVHPIAITLGQLYELS